MGIFLAYQPTEPANSLWIDVCDQAPHRSLKIHDQKSLMPFYTYGQDRACSMSLALIPITTPNTMIMYNND